MIVLGYILAISMGVTLGLTGAGGSILSVPILVYFLKAPPILATSYSLLIVGITALVGGTKAYINKQVDVKTVLVFAIPSFIAVYITRRWLIGLIPDPFIETNLLTLSKDTSIMLLFAAMMLWSSFLMIRPKKTVQQQPKKYSPSLRALLIGVEGFAVGIFTGIIGAGGGFLIIPALVILVGLDMKRAVGSSLLIIALKSLIGFGGDLQTGVDLDYSIIAGLLCCTTIGMWIGSILSQHLPANIMRKIFGWFTLIIAFVILVKECF